MSNLIWYAHYCPDNHDRLLELKSFDRLYKAKKFMENRRGVITRQEWDNKGFKVMDHLIHSDYNNYFPHNPTDYNNLRKIITVPYAKFNMLPASW